MCTDRAVAVPNLRRQSGEVAGFFTVVRVQPTDMRFRSEISQSHNATPSENDHGHQPGEKLSFNITRACQRSFLSLVIYRLDCDSVHHVCE